MVVPLDYTINKNAHGASDDATLNFRIKGNPDFGALTRNGKPYAITIYAGFPTNPNPGAFSTRDLVPRFIGVVDEFHPDFVADTCEATCRSFAAVLIDTKITAQWLGDTHQTTTTVGLKKGALEQLAEQYGFTVNVQLRPNLNGSGKAQQPATLGQLYNADFVQYNQNIAVWDLFLAMAQLDDVDIWVDGQTLNYVAPELVNRPRMYFQWGKDIEGLDGTHSPQYSKFIKVEVRSYDKRTRTSYSSITSQSDTGVVTTQTRQTTSTSQQDWGTPTITTSTYSISSTGATRTAQSTVTAQGGTQSSGFAASPSDSLNETYVKSFPGLTREACDARSLAIWRQISAHEFRASMKRPVTHEFLPNLDVQSIFVLQGTPWTSFDSPYFCKRLTETFSVSQGDQSESDGWKFDTVLVNHMLPTDSTL